MENVNLVNNLSPGLRKLVKDAMPKNGQTFWFVSVRPNARGTTVLPYDRIFDPFGGEDGNGDYIDIAYIIGRDPGKGPNGRPQDNLGRIQFTKASAGRIGVRGGDKDGELKFEFMYLTNQLRNNAPTKEDPDGKQWFVPGKQQVFYMQEPEKTAAQKLEDNRKIRQAGAAIDDMPESKLRDFASGLDMTGITKFSSDDEIRVKLLQMANTVQGATRVLSLDKDTNLTMKIQVKSAEKLNIISFDQALSSWIWVDGQDTICVVPPGKTKYDPLVVFLLSTKGSSTLKLLTQILNKESQEEKKPSKAK